ncbi:MAG: ABC transporter ATP-binding protein [Acidimicrobiia bacterium]
MTSTTTTTGALEIDDLVVEFATEDGTVHAVNGVSLRVQPGETLAVVGESGSGKSVTALSIMGLIRKPGQIVSGTIQFDGCDLRTITERNYQQLRGGDLAMIFQDPLSSMNPSFRVGSQIAEAIRAHSDVSKDDAWARAIELLAQVGIPQPEQRARDYPHQFSGGMRQRAMIAMAMANAPKLLIADEPTTALDVTIQAQVLEVLKAAQRETDAAMVLITHDLGIVAGLADRVVVMYAGRVVEEGTLDEIFYDPRHPYTIGLLGSIPRLGGERGQRLRTIPGTPPGLFSLAAGCAFAPRCPYVIDRCGVERPDLLHVDNGGPRRSACFRIEELPELRGGEAP